MRSRPVTARASRIASVFAWLADKVNCQNGSPQRRASSSATTIESSVGSMNCGPAATRFCTARTTGAGFRPQNVLLSPMFVSRKRMPSAQTKLAPIAQTGQTGCTKLAAIHCMGVPCGIEARARSAELQAARVLALEARELALPQLRHTGDVDTGTGVHG